jgi:drug/metabolite transporter (DMT)-like permease
MRKSTPLPYLVLFAGVVIVSLAAIMIRYLQNPPVEMPSTVIAAGRLTFASLILTPIAWSRVGSELRALGRREIGLGIASGILLALHFDSWIASMEYTSVASSVALVSTNPLWVALIAFVLWREKPLPLAMLGIGLAIAGSVLIGISDGLSSSQAAFDTSSRALFGDFLALVGALTVSGYLLIGRSLRNTLSLLAYIWLVYSSAAVVLIVIALGFGDLQPAQLTSYPWWAYLLLLGLAIGPQLLGHSSFNWALRHLSPTFVTVSMLGEPIGSAVAAWLLFGESFQSLQLLGFVLLMVGIVAATLAEQRASKAAQPAEALS